MQDGKAMMIPEVRAFGRRALLVCAVLLIAGPIPSVLADMSSYCSVPPNVSTGIPPNVMIILDNSGSMDTGAYTDSYNPALFPQGYYGYFDPARYYQYTTSNTWEVTTAPITDGTLTNPIAQGGFLNWATMRRVDIAKKVLTGGRADPRSPQGSTVKLLGESTLTGNNAIKFFNFAKTHDSTSDPTLFYPFIGSFTYKMVVNELSLSPVVYPKSNLNVSAAWTVTGVTNAWDAVDELLADGDTTYIQNNTNTDRALFASTGLNPCPTGSTLPICSQTITGITVKTNAEKTGTTTLRLKGTLQVGGTTYDSSLTSLDTTYKNKDFLWTTNPATTLAWKWSDLSTLEGFGVKLDATPTSGNAVRVTQVYLEITVANAPLYKVIVDHGMVPVTGILDTLGDSVRFGLAYYRDGNGLENSTPTTDGKNDGGFVENKIDFGTTTPIVTSINNMVPYTYTPLAESVYEMIRHFRQETPYYANTPPDFQVSQLDDPYYFQYTKKAGSSLPDQYVPCAKSFILLMTDGESTMDQNIPAKLQDYDKDGKDVPPPTTSPFGSDFLDDVALWGRTTDHRDLLEGTQDLVGVQNVFLYNVFMFGKGSQLLKDASINGGFNDLNNDGMHGPDLAESRRETDGDGVLTTADFPLTYFEGQDGYQLEASVTNALVSILNQAASGTAVSVLTTASRDVGSLLQAYFLPTVQDGLRQVKWVGYLQNLWVDKAQNLREDTVVDKQLELDKDHVMKLFFDKDAGEARVSLFTTDSEGQGGDLSSCTATTTKPFDEITPIFEAGKRLASRPPSERKIFTSDIVRHGASQLTTGCTSLNCFTTTEIGPTSTLGVALNADPVPSAYTQENIIRYVRGECMETSATGDASCGPTADTRFRDRRLPVENDLKVWKLGDIINATPKTLASVPVNTYHTDYGDRTYYDYATSDTYQERSAMTFAGANDGMLHAFRLGHLQTDFSTETSFSTTIKALYKNFFGSAITEQDRVGEEAWSYIPYNAFPYLRYLADPNYCHIYFNDLPVKLFDASIGNSSSGDISSAPKSGITAWRTILIGGMRFGGSCDGGTAPAPPIPGGPGFSSYYAIDVTDAENPIPLWEFSDPDMGYATTSPAILRTGSPDNNGNWYIVVGSGSTQLPKTLTDIARDRASFVYLLDLKTGALVQKVELPVNAVVGDLIAIDADKDYYTEKVYFGTAYQTGLNWDGTFFSLSIPNTPLNTPATLTLTALFEGQGDEHYPFMASPDAAVDVNHNLWVYAGSGKYYSDLDETTTGDQIILGIIDSNKTFTTSDLTDQTLVTTTGTIAATDTACLYDATQNIFRSTKIVTEITPTGVTPVLTKPDGWYLTLTGGERVITKPAAVGGLLDILTYTPSLNVCDYSGHTSIYAVNATTGAAPASVALLAPDVITDSSGNVVTDLSTAGIVTVQKGYVLGQGAPPTGEGIIVSLPAEGETTLIKNVQLGTVAIAQPKNQSLSTIASQIQHWLKK